MRSSPTASYPSLTLPCRSSTIDTMEETVSDGEKLLLNGKPFLCDCGGVRFIHVTHEDSWKCVSCEARYRRENGGRIDAGPTEPEG
jgi:hypothetical protein